mmetsp:Transcript_30591/g.107535  ORF Transcript_30591/g.107535 Transcript_30591/m.107535 type:complete len:163 (+) Transcript_30591:49-537(+)
MAMRTGLASGRALLPRAPSMAPRRLLSSADGAGAGPEGLSDYWRMMESRVVKRKTREVGAGPSGRGRRDTTAWSAEAKSDGTGAAEAPVAGAPAFPGRLSVARIKEGHFAQARLVYETEIAPLLRESDDLLSNVLLLDHSKGVRPAGRAPRRARIPACMSGA